MLTIQEIEKCIRKANEVLYSIDNKYKPPIITDIKISKARSFFGQIRKKGDVYTLKISNMIDEADEQHRETLLMSVVIHELIHTCPKCFNHGYEFKYWCYKVNRRYPEYHIVTKTDGKEYGIKEDEKHARWYVECEKCHKHYNYERKPRVDLKRCHCKCGCRHLTLHQNFS